MKFTAHQIFVGVITAIVVAVMAPVVWFIVVTMMAISR